MRRGSALGLLLAAACGGAGEGPGEAPPATGAGAPLLREVTATCGIDFRHVHGGLGNRELPETMGGGVGAIDHDGDGDRDLYFVQSGPVRLPDGSESRAGAENRLYRNDGSARFEDVPGAAGAADAGYGQGCAVGDFDGDGRDDLLSLNWGPNVLYRNTGGAFEDASSAAGLLDEDRWSVSAAFFDADGDGDLDLYVVNYLDSPPSSHLDPEINQGHNGVLGPFVSYPHPDHFQAQGDRFYRNDGNGVLVEATAGAGLDVAPGKGLGVASLDLELDGRLDLYVTNDSTPNFLFHNLGEGRFEEIGARSGAAVNGSGRTEAGMGVDLADVDEDGDFDVFVTNLDTETNTLYATRVQAGRIELRDATRSSGLSEPSRMRVGFGALFFDVDRDADTDLLVANGHIIDNPQVLSDVREYPQPNQLLLNDGKGRFELAPVSAAPGLERPTVSRGSALADLDGDGDLDVVLTGNNEGVQVFLGEPGPGAWLCLRLDGPPGNHRGVGASVWLELEDGRSLLRHIETARSYASASEAVLAQGLPSAVRAVEVLWPGGRRERWPGSTGTFAAPFAGEQRLAHGSGAPVD